MDSNIIINSFIQNINIIRDNEFLKFNFKINDNNIETKKSNVQIISKDFINFNIDLKKKASIEKYKPSNISKIDYDNATSNINILEDDIFNDNEEKNDDNFKLNLDNLNKEEKLSLINEYLVRKNIILETSEYIKLDKILDNEEISLKKYFNVSKLYQKIIKITFIKKLENGSFIIDLNDNKPKKVKNYFLKK